MTCRIRISPLTHYDVTVIGRRVLFEACADEMHGKNASGAMVYDEFRTVVARGVDKAVRVGEPLLMPLFNDWDELASKLAERNLHRTLDDVRRRRAAASIQRRFFARRVEMGLPRRVGYQAVPTEEVQQQLAVQNALDAVVESQFAFFWGSDFNTLGTTKEREMASMLEQARGRTANSGAFARAAWARGLRCVVEASADDAAEAHAKAREPVPCVVICDAGHDASTELAMVQLAHLTEQGLVACKGVVATLRPQHERALLLRGTLDELGLHDVPVGVGTDGGAGHTHTVDEGFSAAACAAYAPAASSEQAHALRIGRRLLRSAFEGARPRSLALVCLSSLKDAAIFLRDNEELFVSKVKSVTIVGGVKPPEFGADAHSTALHEVAADAGGPDRAKPDSGGGASATADDDGRRLVPDAAAHNHAHDRPAADFFYRRCQELGVPLVVVTRHAACAAPLPRSLYDQVRRRRRNDDSSVPRARISSLRHDEGTANAR